MAPTGELEGDNSESAVSVTSKLIVQQPHPAQGKKRPITKQETKVKTFDFVFAATRDNYVLFLNTILKKHSSSISARTSSVWCMLQLSRINMLCGPGYGFVNGT